MSIQTSEERWLYRIGGVSAVLGAVIGLVGNLAHPMTDAPGLPETAREIAASAIWIPLHFSLIVGFLLILGGLVAFQSSIEGPLARALGRLAIVFATVGTTVGVIILTTDGFAAPHLAEAWLSATPDQQPHALAAFQAEQAIDFALLSPLNLVFSGFTFAFFGVAAAVSENYPRWLGWIVVVAGVGGSLSGLIQAYMGEPTPISVAVGIGAPTIITFWVIWVGMLLFSRASPRGTLPKGTGL